ncbi:endogenous retrovirus group K member 10 Gag polyprotein-like [Moschus berezovskii]|uniref:endogenous retrovirus group K member 10 Gag polyprotein-like n=1 Tax=Moschus berezovskii TaxID=68408 RepID=UPI0024443842|nr:endogenous retrovirus group K member 10 Gag polyprotein-like [Moschus berezovskii]
MGQNNSRQFFVHMLQIMLKDRGIRVSTPRLNAFLAFVEEVCPWFPKEGTVNLETWKKVGKQIQAHYTLHGPGKMPVDTFSLWSLIRDCLDLENGEESRLKDKIQDDPPPPESSIPPLQESPLDPEDTETLEEAAAKYHQEDWELLMTDAAGEEKGKTCIQELECLMKQLLSTIKDNVDTPPLNNSAAAPLSGPKKSISPSAPPAYASFLSPLQQALKQAQQEGEVLAGYPKAFPVFENANQRYYEPLPFKQLKELKVACAQYGPTAPFTQAMVENLGGQNLPPSDWKQIARACLTGGDYLLWKSEFTEQCGVIAETNQRQGLPTTYEMLIGEGPYLNTNAQLNYHPGAYAQISNAARQAWRKLPCSANKTEDLSKIRQGPDEPYQDFVARLLEAVGKLMADEQAGMVLTKQLAYENANSACQAALRPYRKKGVLSDYIRICADIGPSYMQGITLAAALQGKSIKEVLYQQQIKNKRRPIASGNAGCFVCGQPGHRAAFCPQRGNTNNVRTPNTCKAILSLPCRETG